MGSGAERGPPIYLAYLNGYAPEWADALAGGLAELFPRALQRLNLTLELRSSYAPARGQYEATLILAGLLRHLPEEGAKIVGITTVDLFMPVLTFVFGLSQLHGPGAVISTYRLRPEFYGLPADEGLVLERAVKGAAHELGHAFGLVHCPDYRCLMHSATYVEDVDLKAPRFCPDCRALLDARILPAAEPGKTSSPRLCARARKDGAHGT